MGVNLTLYFLTDLGKIKDQFIFCRDSLDFQYDQDIFGQLVEGFEGITPTIKTTPIAQESVIERYEIDGLIQSRFNLYGKVITFVSAEELSRIKVSQKTSARNKAILAFVKALPRDTPIILFWW